MGKKYNIIISLGEDCACSSYLRRHKLQFLSFPFDWLTNATLKQRFDLILNNFDNFLNIEDLKFLEKDLNVKNDNDCDYYENIRNGFYHYHDFPVNKNLEDAFDEAKAKYNRRIARFYDKIKESEKILFVWLSHLKNNDDAMIKNKHDEICQKFAKNIDLLIIENDKSKKGTDIIEEVIISDNITRYALDTASFDISKDQTLGNILNCNKIFVKYKLKLPLLFIVKNKVEKMKKKIVKKINKIFHASKN